MAQDGKLKSSVTLRTLGFICSRFLTTRLILFAIAVFAVVRMPINATEARGFHLAPQPHAYLEAWARYDACWYVSIGPMAAPWQPFVDLWQTGPRLHAYGNSLVDGALALAALAMLPPIHARVRPKLRLLRRPDRPDSTVGIADVVQPPAAAVVSACDPVGAIREAPGAVDRVAHPVRDPRSHMMAAFATWNWVA